MELLIFIVLVLIWLSMPSKHTVPETKQKPSMTAAQRELSAQWASEEAKRKKQNVAALKTLERSLLEEDVERLLARVGDVQLANALGVHRSATRDELVSRASDLGRDGAYAIAVAHREVA